MEWKWKIVECIKRMYIFLNFCIIINKSSSLILISARWCIFFQNKTLKQANSCFLFLLSIVNSQLTRHQGLSINRAFIFSYTVKIREKKLFPEYYKKIFRAIGILFLLTALVLLSRLSRTAKTPFSLNLAK